MRWQGHKERSVPRDGGPVDQRHIQQLWQGILQTRGVNPRLWWLTVCVHGRTRRLGRLRRLRLHAVCIRQPSRSVREPQLLPHPAAAALSLTWVVLTQGRICEVSVPGRCTPEKEAHAARGPGRCSSSALLQRQLLGPWQRVRCGQGRSSGQGEASVPSKQPETNAFSGSPSLPSCQSANVWSGASRACA